MSCYMRAAAMCDLSVAGKGPVKVDEKAILASQLASREWDCVERAAGKVRSAEVTQLAKKPEEQVQNLEGEPDIVALMRDGTYKGGAEYDTIGSKRVRAKAAEMDCEREKQKLLHEEEEKQLKEEHETEAKEKDDDEIKTVVQKAQELEVFLNGKREERHNAMEIAQQAAEEEILKHQMHPIDVLQSQIAAELEAEREAELSEMEATDPSWMDKLDMYMVIEKDAWREHSALQRQKAIPFDEAHIGNIEAMRDTLEVK